MRINFSEAKECVDAVDSLAVYTSSPTKRAELYRKLVVLRKKHVTIALLSAGADESVDDQERESHISTVKTLLQKGTHQATTPSAFAAAFGMLAQAHDAVILLNHRCQQGFVTLSEKEREDLQGSIEAMQNSVKKSASTLRSAPNVCSSMLLWQAAAVGFAGMSLPDQQEKSKAAFAAFKIVKGAIKSAVTMKVSTELLQGLVDAGKLGMAHYKRAHAALVAGVLSDIRIFSAKLQLGSEKHLPPVWVGDAQAQEIKEDVEKM